MKLHSICIALALAVASGCGEQDPGAFESAEDAAAALLQSVEEGDDERLIGILGAEYRDRIITSEWEAEREARLELVEASKQQVALRDLPGGEMEVMLGPEEWPFPILLYQDEQGAWRFDTEEGIEEMIDRRIGRHELTALAIARTYVDAQIEYARQDRDGDGVLEYAQRLASTPGKRDGLYWEEQPGEPLSPFGPLVQKAESYLEKKEPGEPIQGYFFRILTRQGENPPGGAYEYVIDGNMIAGFALVAYPEDHGNTGVMTFVVSHRGKVWEKDLGPFTGMDAYDPDESWALAAD